MADGMWTILVATSTFVVAYATWWLVRHERAVRRFRGDGERSGTRDQR